MQTCNTFYQLMCELNESWNVSKLRIFAYSIEWQISCAQMPMNYSVEKEKNSKFHVQVWENPKWLVNFVIKFVWSWCNETPFFK